MTTIPRVLLTVLAAVLLAGLAPLSASADPLPPFDLDAGKLEQRMDACMGGQMGNDDLLMAWVSFRDGSQRQWRCWSLKHMLIEDYRNPHDPYANVEAFMRCMDRTVSYGFPRPSKDSPQNRNLILTWGGANQATLAYNETTNDIVTLYTSPRADDWASCAARGGMPG